MASTLSPNMDLIIPTVGQEPGPTWAQDLNASLTIIDQHNHSAGSGVQINPAGININTSLTFNNNFAINVAGLTLTGQGSTPANNSVYNSNNSSGDLYYVNNAGLNIQLTNASGIVGSAGSISGISGTASASYSNPTFFWRSATSIAANMDFAAAIMRNISPNSTFALTLQPPAALASNFTITLPTIPGAQSFMAIDASGNMSAFAAVSAGITGSMIAATTVANSNIVNSTITGAKIANNVALVGKTVSANAQYVTTSNTNGANSGLSIVRALIASNGTITIGEGITTVHSVTGQYTINFNTAFFDAPAVCVTANASTAIICTVDSLSASSCRVLTTDQTNTAVESGFSIIAIAQKT